MALRFASARLFRICRLKRVANASGLPAEEGFGAFWHLFDAKFRGRLCQLAPMFEVPAIAQTTCGFREILTQRLNEFTGPSVLPSRRRLDGSVA